MGIKEDKEFFWGVKSNITTVLIILGAMVIGNFLYDNYKSFVRDKQNEQHTEINKSKENLRKQKEAEEKAASEQKRSLEKPVSVRKVQCIRCKGTGEEEVTCEECNGTGKRGRQRWDCYTCDRTGTRVIKCRAKDCNGGRVPEYTVD